MPCGLPGFSGRRAGSYERNAPLRLRILLTNGRFPVSLDLARQLQNAGHFVYVVDPMRNHVCKHSTAVTSCLKIPAPHEDAQGYTDAVRQAIITWEIDVVIPVHEEILYLAECDEPEIRSRLLAPPFDLLVRLHNKWEFSKLMELLDFDVPEHFLCQNYQDVKDLPVDKFPHGLALKPCFGRSSTRVYHLKAGEPLPSEDKLNIGDQSHYIAQDWLKGTAYSSYSVVRHGEVIATSVYPTLDTMATYSSIYVSQLDNPRIYGYVDNFVQRVAHELGYAFSGQIAFDFIEVGSRLVAIECNPHSTSGLHLWSGTPQLAEALTDTVPRTAYLPIKPAKHRLGYASHAQIRTGMLWWQHKDATAGVYLKHMARLLSTGDVVWRTLDPMPSISQPFLLTKYYRMCREAKLQLPELFQLDLLWEPKDHDLARVRRVMSEADEHDEKVQRGEKPEDDLVVGQADDMDESTQKMGALKHEGFPLQQDKVGVATRVQG